MKLETFILGSILVDQSVHDIAIPELHIERFSCDRDILAIIKEMYAKNEPIDLYTVYPKIPDRFDRLSEMANSIASGANVMNYIAELNKQFLRSQLTSMFGDRLTYEDDPNQYLSEKISTLTDLQESLTPMVHKPWLEILDETVNRVLERRLHPEKCFGVATPLTKLNTLTNGWQGGNLIIFAGRPSMGKTSFALANVISACKSGKSVALFSMEMSYVEVTERMLWSLGMEPEEAAGVMSRWRLEIFDRGAMDLDYIRSNSRLIKRLKGLDLIAVDYLGLMKMPRGEKRSYQIGEVTRSLKTFAKEINVPLILLSQLNRDIEGRKSVRHQLSDLRESGDIEQDADIVLFISRPSKLGFEEIDGLSTENMTLIQVEKNRNGNAPVDVIAKHNSLGNYFRDWEFI